MASRFGAILLVVLLPLAARAAPPAVVLTEIAFGLSAPVEIAITGPGSSRLYVAEQGGRIRIVENGQVLGNEFLDISTLLAPGGERGLLGLAFHPNYAANGAFYVFYTRSGDGALTLARYLRDAIDPDTANPASGAVLLAIPHPSNANHNGGRLAFGPDGHLYVGTGDGGGGGDPNRNAQNTGNLLGKILRIAVDGGPGYTIPAANPFSGSACAGNAGQCPEILHFGLRNPWKFSFDRANGDLYVGDVGQESREEVDYLPAGTPGGANFGWGVFEGDACFNDEYFGSPGACASLASRVDPVITYGHNATGGYSITGGYVYRGPGSAALLGYYIYADFISRRIWAARNTGASWEVSLLLAPAAALGNISSFGEDADGKLYVADHANGKIWRIDPLRAASDFSGDGRSDVFWRDTSGGLDYQWQMNGFAISGQGYMSTVPTSWIVAGLGDLNGDGRSDVLWRDAGGLNYLWMMNGIAISGQGHLPQVPNPWIVVGLGDADGDGRADVFWRNPATGQNYLWIMNGLSIASQRQLPLVPGLDWEVAGVADHNGDSRADVFWRNKLTGQNYLWMMNGLVISGQGYLPTVASSDWEVAGAPDANGDGKADVLWRNKVTGQSYLWLMNGLALSGQGYLPSVADTNWKAAGYGDYNGDGKGDVLWRHASSGQNYSWTLNGIGVATQGPLPGVSGANWQPVKR